MERQEVRSHVSEWQTEGGGFEGRDCLGFQGTAQKQEWKETH